MAELCSQDLLIDITYYILVDKIHTSKTKIPQLHLAKLLPEEKTQQHVQTAASQVAQMRF